MGSTQNTGPTGPDNIADETVDDIKAALRPADDAATQNDRPQRMSVIQLGNELRRLARRTRSPRISGENACATLCEFQSLLIIHGYDVSRNDGYILGGFASYDDFLRAADRHALREASISVQLALANESAVFTEHDIDLHPVGQWENAFQWLQRSSLPLFADSTYAPLGLTHHEFFEKFSQAHINAARQKIALSRTVTENALGFAMMDSVCNDHLPRLGAQKMEGPAAHFLDSSAQEIATLYKKFCEGEFRQILHEIRMPDAPIEAKEKSLVVLADFRKAHDGKQKKIATHPYVPGSDRWHEKILEAADLIIDDCVMSQAPSAFEGTQFSPTQFKMEFQKTVEAVMRQHVSAVMSEDVTPQDLEEGISMFLNLRAMHGPVKAPKDCDPMYESEDYWFYPLMREFGLRSFTHLMDHCQVTNAASIINAMISVDGVPPHEVYEDLAKARNILSQARFPADDRSMLAKINVGYYAMEMSLRQTAPHAANHDWSMAHHVGYPNDKRFVFMEQVHTARDMLDGMLEKHLLDFTEKSARAHMRKLAMRQIENTLLEGCICIPESHEIHAVVTPAFDSLRRMRMDLKDPAIHEPMGMDAARARYYDGVYRHLDVLDRWHQAVDDTKDANLRLGHLRALRGITARMSPEERARFVHEVRDDHALKSTIPGMLREVAVGLFHLTMDDLDFCYGDPIETYETLCVAVNCLKAIHPHALKNDITFRRAVGRDRMTFINAFEASKEQVRRLTELSTGHAHWRGEASSIIRAASSHDVKAEDAFMSLRDLSRMLRLQGRSILDPDVLKLAGHSPETLSTLTDRLVLRAAHDCIIRARDKSGLIFRPTDVEDHPYHDYRRALRWLSRGHTSVLKDRPWRAMGFAGRYDFADTLRDSLVNMTSQLETLVITRGAGYMAPHVFLDVLRQITHGYEILDYRDDVTRERMRVSIRNMADAAITAIIQSPPVKGTATDTEEPAKSRQRARRIRGDLSRQHRMLRTLAKFINTIDNRIPLETDPDLAEIAEKRKNDYAQRIDTEMRNLALARIDHALEYHASLKSAAPVRGAQLATAIGTMRREGDKVMQAALEEMMPRHHFHSFEAFSLRYGTIRMRQLVRRIGQATQTKRAIFNNPKTWLAIYNDIDRIDGIVDNDVMNARDRMGLLHHMDLPDDWLAISRKQAAVKALPLLARNAQDPLLTISERWDMLRECNIMGQAVGSEKRGQLGVPWKKLDAIATQTALVSASLQMMADQMRGDWTRIGFAMVDANRMLNMAGMTMEDIDTLRKLGLEEDEAYSIADIAAAIPAYKQLAPLQKALHRNESPHEVMNALCDFFNTCEETHIDPATPENKHALGFTQDTWLRNVDSKVIECLKGIHAGTASALQQKDTAQIRLQLDAALNLMDISKIESRYSDELLKKAGALSRAEIMASYRAVKAPAKTPKPKL